MIKATITRDARLHQGDIIRNVPLLDNSCERDGVLEITWVVFPLAIVLSQECDLQEDHRLSIEHTQMQDKRLISVLVAPMYNAEHLFAGVHLEELGIEADRQNRERKNLIMTNQNPRYHYLEFPMKTGLVPVVIDFKHYFSVNTIDLKNEKRTSFVCSVSAIYREQVLQRYASYLSRIGLPNMAT